MTLVAEASNGCEAIEQFRRYRPDITLMDLQMPIMGGQDAIRAIRVILQKLVDAIVSASNEARIREQVEMAGVSA